MTTAKPVTSSITANHPQPKVAPAPNALKAEEISKEVLAARIEKEMNVHQKVVDEAAKSWFFKKGVTKEKTVVVELADKVAQILKDIFLQLMEQKWGAPRDIPRTFQQEKQIVDIASRLKRAYELRGFDHHNCRLGDVVLRQKEAQNQMDILIEKAAKTREIKGKIKELEALPKESVKLEIARRNVELKEVALKGLSSNTKPLLAHLGELIKAKEALLTLEKPASKEALSKEISELKIITQYKMDPNCCIDQILCRHCPPKAFELRELAKIAKTVEKIYKLTSNFLFADYANSSAERLNERAAELDKRDLKAKELREFKPENWTGNVFSRMIWTKESVKLDHARQVAQLERDIYSARRWNVPQADVPKLREKLIGALKNLASAEKQGSKEHIAVLQDIVRFAQYTVDDGDDRKESPVITHLETLLEAKKALAKVLPPSDFVLTPEIKELEERIAALKEK